MAQTEFIRTGEPILDGPLTPEDIQQQEDERRRLEAEIRFSPQIMQSAVLTMLSRYVDTKTEDGRYLTPLTTIQTPEGQDGHSAIVFAGYSEQDYHRKVIYMRDAATGKAAEWIVFSGNADPRITDGSGRPLDADTERGFVRSVIDAMQDSFEKDAVAKAEGFDIKHYAAETLGHQITDTEATLARLRAEIAEIEERTEPFKKFRVSIVSGWEREGEKTLDEVIEADSVAEALRQAAKRFKQLNGRSDVQAQSLSVAAITDKNAAVRIPNEVLTPLFRAVSAWDREGHDTAEARERIHTERLFGNTAT
jgi:hypothetical protein